KNAVDPLPFEGTLLNREKSRHGKRERDREKDRRDVQGQNYIFDPRAWLLCVTDEVGCKEHVNANGATKAPDFDPKPCARARRRSTSTSTGRGRLSTRLGKRREPPNQRDRGTWSYGCFPETFWTCVETRRRHSSQGELAR